MKLSWIFLLFSFSAAVAFADCNSQYGECITDCCSSCGSTLSYDANGDLICEAGTTTNPNQACIDMCLPCSTEYQDCIASGGTDYSGTGSCCGTVFVLAFALLGAFAFIRKQE